MQWLDKKEAFYIQLGVASSVPCQIPGLHGRYIQEARNVLDVRRLRATPVGRRRTVKQIMIKINKFDSFTHSNRIKMTINCRA